MPKTAELLLYDFIGEDWFGDGISARRFADQLLKLDLREGDELTLRVNSPGGFVTEGLAMYNSLLSYPAHKVVRVEGLAASAASFLIQAGDEVLFAPASFAMVHRAWGLTIGDAEAHMGVAAELEKNDGVIADIYAGSHSEQQRQRAKMSRDEWLEAMSEETWYTGSEAVEAGLGDALIDESAAAEPDQTAAALAMLDRGRPYSDRVAFWRRSTGHAQRRQPSPTALRPAAAALLSPTATADLEKRVEVLEALQGLRKESA